MWTDDKPSRQKTARATRTRLGRLERHGLAARIPLACRSAERDRVMRHHASARALAWRWHNQRGNTFAPTQAVVPRSRDSAADSVSATSGAGELARTCGWRQAQWASWPSKLQLPAFGRITSVSTTSASLAADVPSQCMSDSPTTSAMPSSGACTSAPALAAASGEGQGPGWASTNAQPRNRSRPSLH